MKKLLVLLLTASLTFSLAACGAEKDPEPSSQPSQSVESSTPESSKQEESTQEQNNNNENEEQETIASALKDIFINAVKENPDITAEEITTKFGDCPLVEFMSGSMPIEEGLLTGFDNYEVKGFTEGAMFGPMVGSIAFISYVFTLPEDADATAFVQNLKDNSNPRWNICTMADETITAIEGNKVFFAMGPVGNGDEAGDAWGDDGWDDGWDDGFQGDGAL